MEEDKLQLFWCALTSCSKALKSAHKAAAPAWRTSPPQRKHAQMNNTDYTVRRKLLRKNFRPSSPVGQVSLLMLTISGSTQGLNCPGPQIIILPLPCLAAVWLTSSKPNAAFQDKRLCFDNLSCAAEVSLERRGFQAKQDMVFGSYPNCPVMNFNMKHQQKN